MRQNHWTGACALMIAFGYAGTLHAQEGEANPFADDESLGADAGRGTALAERRIEFILDQPLQTPLEFPETPLNTITGLIEDEYDIPVLFETAALDAIAVSPDVTINVNLRNITLRSALELMLSEVEDLTYLVDNEVLLITTEDEESTRLEVRLYRIDDLIDLTRIESPDDVGGNARADSNMFIDVIAACIERDSWHTNGTGVGMILPIGRKILAISQTARVHREVAVFLEELRRVKREIDEDASHREGGNASTSLASPEGDDDDGE